MAREEMQDDKRQGGEGRKRTERELGKAQQQLGAIKIKCILMVGDKSCGKPRKPIEHFTEKRTQFAKAPSGISKTHTHTHPSAGLPGLQCILGNSSLYSAAPNPGLDSTLFTQHLIPCHLPRMLQ